MNKANCFIKQLNDNIVRIAYSFENKSPENSELISKDFVEGLCNIEAFRQNKGTIDFFFKGNVVLTQCGVSFEEKDVNKCVIDGEPVIRKKLTANGEVAYIENAKSVFERKAYSGKICFRVGKDELLLGLGQYEDGVFDYRDHREYLYESNMRIAIPFLITTGGYAIFIDTQSNMIFDSHDEMVSFEIDTTKDIVYYVITGDSIGSIIESFQNLTGKASMMPRWVYGYVQSKERYKSGDELVDVVKQFRDREIPIDCIVQDWYTWEDGLWGEKIVDKKRYPDLKGTVDTLHKLNTKLMVSIWPNMSPEGENYKEFAKTGGLLENSNVYNAFDEKCRKLYWEQCMREIMSAGTDSLWCDNSEPFSDADWNGQEKRKEILRYELVVNDSKKSMKWEELNSFGLHHAKGIYDNWRKSLPDKRVVNLTRSGYVSSQKYGAILWSGDICARWDVIRKQIVEGMKMGLSGNPYWTLDIGGFFTVKDKYENRGCNNESTEPIWFWKGDYNDGVQDPGYRELYTRWIQFGTFLPMFRSHGTDTPREPWNFINSDDITLPFYETIIKFIKLRYKLLPYIYSLGYKAHNESYIIMRSLAFDFAYDAEALKCTDEYMFGDAFLVAPVCEPMYYGPDGISIEKSDIKYGDSCNVQNKTRRVYLPKAEGWYDFWTNDFYEGGQWIDAKADIEVMPLFVRAGSIIPMGGDIHHSGENNADVKAIAVYEGADGKFELYNDKGDGYQYLNNEYVKVLIEYCDREKNVIIKKTDGSMDFVSSVETLIIRKN